ncbi:MAG: DUF362 domain-containing protein [FCB group bacterium]|nr:DUF362 domain-containing protein [FCB group bacterium]
MMLKINRRSFIRNSALAAGGTLLADKVRGAAADYRGNALDDPSSVVVVTDEGCTTGSTINTDILQIVADTAITVYTGIGDVGEAWISLFPGITSDSVIGIKVSLLNSSVPTNPETADAVINGLLQMPVTGGLNPNNIIIWDRTNYDLSNAGYTINTGGTGVRCFGTNQHGVGYDYANPINVNGVNSSPSKILTELTDYLINLAVLKDHSFSGATLSMKNHYGSVNNPGSLHGGYCNPYIPSLNQKIRDELGDKQKICLIDGLFGMYYGGPTGPPNFIYNGILISEDPVAIDRIGLDILVEAGMNHSWQASHIETASLPPYELGNYDLALIDRIDIENPSLGVSSPEQLRPEGYDLIGNFPNPFNQSTRISFQLERDADVRLEVFDISGCLVKRLVEGRYSPGIHSAVWDGNNSGGISAASGAYICRLTTGGKSISRRMVLIR